ncbi:MAG: 5-(carboxyamino)imidazole ribonucleotide mutase [Spirochaetaceae bacterium]|jgi:5-(carboxyamino)imidazole ribonucleotide mutase|nr:5-(carboxyamino)imidazole ribonucleotide mutase [Spirochaetaceae bacterium]
MKVAIMFGSPSDTPVMEKAAQVLRELAVFYSAHILSAHRTPELLHKTVKELEDNGTEVIIAGAGLAAHLPGVIASLTTIPVIGVPINAGSLGGMDALLSMVQMPRPIPVAVVGVDNGANAAHLACEILALKYSDLRERLRAFRAAVKAEGEKNGEKVAL